MATRTPAQRLLLANIVLIVVLSVLFVLCLVRRLWLPAAIFAMFMFTNALQIRLRRRVEDG